MYKEIDTANDWLSLICDIAIDYDGCRSVNSLMGLIDEMKKYAINAMKCIQNDKIK